MDSSSDFTSRKTTSSSQKQLSGLSKDEIQAIIKERVEKAKALREKSATSGGTSTGHHTHVRANTSTTHHEDKEEGDHAKADEGANESDDGAGREAEAEGGTSTDGLQSLYSVVGSVGDGVDDDSRDAIQKRIRERKKLAAEASERQQVEAKERGVSAKEKVRAEINRRVHERMGGVSEVTPTRKKGDVEASQSAMMEERTRTKHEVKSERSSGEVDVDVDVDAREGRGRQSTDRDDSEGRGRQSTDRDDSEGRGRQSTDRESVRERMRRRMESRSRSQSRNASPEVSEDDDDQEEEAEDQQREEPPHNDEYDSDDGGDGAGDGGGDDDDVEEVAAHPKERKHIVNRPAPSDGRADQDEMSGHISNKNEPAPSSPVHVESLAGKLASNLQTTKGRSEEGRDAMLASIRHGARTQSTVVAGGSQVSHSIQTHFDRMQEHTDLTSEVGWSEKVTAALGSNQQPSKETIEDEEDKAEMYIIPDVKEMMREEESTFEDTRHSEHELQAYSFALRCILLPIPDESQSFLMFSTQSLLTLLRSAFKVSKRLHERLVDRIRDSLDEETIFAELDVQLKSLECHRYYSEAAFPDTEAYAVWKRRERDRINRQIRLCEQQKGSLKQIWCCSVVSSYIPFLEQLEAAAAPQPLPAPADVKRMAETDHHSMYKILLHTLLLFENGEAPPEDEEEGEDKTPSEATLQRVSPLSPTSTWILEQYGARFCVGSTYQKLSHLLVLARHFEHLPSHLNLIKDMLKELSEGAMEGGRWRMTRAEKVLYNEIVDMLHAQIQNRLCKFKVCFPNNKPTGSLRTLVSILALLPSAQITGLHEMLEEYVRLSVANRYQILKLLLMSEEPLPGDDKLSTDVRRLLKSCDAVEEEMSEDVRLFNDSFPSDFALADITGEEMFRWLSMDVEAFCNEWSKEEVSEEVLDLFFKVKGLMQKLKISDTELLNLFDKFISSWVEHTSHKLQGWVTEAVSCEEWRPISDTLFHSASVVDVFNACSQAVSFMVRIDLPRKSVLQRFAAVLSHAIRSYIDMCYPKEELEEPEVHTTPSSTRTTPTSTPRVTPRGREREDEDRFSIRKVLGLFGNGRNTPRKMQQRRIQTPEDLGITTVTCVKLCNLDVSRQHVHDIVTLLEDHYAFGDSSAHETLFGHNFDQTFSFLRTRVDSAMGSLMNKLKDGVVDVIVDIMIADPAEDTPHDVVYAPLLEYIGVHLMFLSKNVYSDLFNKLLRRFYAVVLEVMEGLVLDPDAVGLGPIDWHQLSLVMELLEPLKCTFHAGGEGLTVSYIDDETARLRGMFSLVAVPTRELVQLHATMEDDPLKVAGGRRSTKKGDMMYMGIDKPVIESILKARKDDYEAEQFIESLLPPVEDGSDWL